MLRAQSISELEEGKKDTGGSGLSFTYRMAQEPGFRKAQAEQRKCYLGSPLAENLGKQLLYSSSWQFCLACLLFRVRTVTGLHPSQSYVWPVHWVTSKSGCNKPQHPSPCFNLSRCFSLGSTPQRSLGSPTQRDSSVYMLWTPLHLWDRPDESQFLQEGFLCKRFVEDQVAEELPSKPNSINIRINNDPFSTWLLTAGKS